MPLVSAHTPLSADARALVISLGDVPLVKSNFVVTLHTILIVLGIPSLSSINSPWADKSNSADIHASSYMCILDTDKAVTVIIFMMQMVSRKDVGVVDEGHVLGEMFCQSLQDACESCTHS